MKPVSLKAVAQNRYSTQLLSEEFKLAIEVATTAQSSGNSKKEKQKVITFRRNEIFFDGRPGVMLNLRDLTEDESLSRTVRVSQQLQQVNSNIHQEVVGPFEMID